MARMKIKCRPNNREQKLKLIGILSTKDIKISRIIAIHDGLAVLTLNELHADCIFNAHTKSDIKSHGFNAIMPPELRVKKSVILSRVNEIIHEKHVIDIGEELQKQIPWIGEEIVDIYKFPKSTTLKITFSQTTLALECTEKGLKAFNISIPPDKIEQETYVPIKCCMKCLNPTSQANALCIEIIRYARSVVKRDTYGTNAKIPPKMPQL